MTHPERSSAQIWDGAYTFDQTMHAVDFVLYPSWSRKMPLARSLLLLALSLQVTAMASTSDSPPTTAFNQQSLSSSTLLGTDTAVEFGLRVATDLAGAAYIVGTGVKPTAPPPM